MAGLLKAQFACYVRFNFDPAFHKKSGFPIRLSKTNQAFHIFSRPERRHIKWYVVNQWFNNILKKRISGAMIINRHSCANCRSRSIFIAY
jgi:hypothetical protein